MNDCMIDLLEPKIVDNGTLTIDSIFRFEKCIEDFPAFLHIAEKRNCIVEFENEGYVFKPNDDSTETHFLISGLMVYMSFGKLLFEKRIQYLLKLLPNDDWVKGQHEPILKGGK